MCVCVCVCVVSGNGGAGGYMSGATCTSVFKLKDGRAALLRSLLNNFL